MRRDITWFQDFLKVYNGSNSFVHKPLCEGMIVELDASLTGMGAVFGKWVYKVSLLNVSMATDMSIVHLEMWNILVACKIWGTFWKKQQITIKCDNLAVVIVLNKGGTKDSMLATLARNIWFEMAKQDFQLVVKHIEGKANLVADLLSRWDQNTDSCEKLAQLVPGYRWSEVCDEQLVINHCI